MKCITHTHTTKWNVLIIYPKAKRTYLLQKMQYTWYHEFKYTFFIFYNKRIQYERQNNKSNNSCFPSILLNLGYSTQKKVFGVFPTTEKRHEHCICDKGSKFGWLQLGLFSKPKINHGVCNTRHRTTRSLIRWDVWLFVVFSYLSRLK